MKLERANFVLILSLFAFSRPVHADGEMIRTLNTNIATFPDVACEILAFLKTNSMINALDPATRKALIFAWDMESAQNHRGVQTFNGKRYGENSIAAIETAVVAAGTREDLRPMTAKERELLGRQLVGQAPMDLKNKDSYDYTSEAERIIAENAKEPGWQNGDPRSTLWGGNVKAVPEQLVGRLISGYDWFGPTLTFYAGKVRRVFAVEFFGTKAARWMWAEIEMPAGEIVSVPLSYTAKEYAFNIYGDPLSSNWFKQPNVIAPEL